MRLSIIIPMYNCARVIERCLNSIDRIEESEIIVVDDGSTDNGGEVVSRFVSEDSRVRLLTKENGGVSSARNMGIEHSRGRYLMFIDADDYLVHGGLERILSIAENINADVLKYQLKKVEKTEVTDTASISEEPIVYEIIHGKGAPLTCASVSDYHVVDGLFRRELIIENKIRLHEDLFLHEDDVFMAEVFAKAKCVVATQLPLYRYVSDSQYSHTHKPTLERARRIVDSALLAVQYRFDATSSLNNPKVVFHERLKAMRFVYLCSRHMISAGYSLSEYRETLNRFRPYGCYPLDYRWLRESLAVTPKLLFKTFLCNHPKIAYLIYK